MKRRSFILGALAAVALPTVAIAAKSPELHHPSIWGGHSHQFFVRYWMMVKPGDTIVRRGKFYVVVRVRPTHIILTRRNQPHDFLTMWRPEWAILAERNTR